MCGIAGFYDGENKLKKENLLRMTHALVHRGPDACGHYYNNKIGLGHRRLSILDLSDAANQPFFSSCGKYVMVYNGEVYNYKELIPLLDKPLRTSSDTEVILELFVKYGEDFVSHLNGMFAFAIYDIEREELFLYRDRIGVKPLVYFWDGSTFAFGSEIKTLLTLPSDIVKKEINVEAIAYFLHVNFIPDPLSAFRNIFKMEAGTYMKVSSRGIDKKRYWNLNAHVKNEILKNEEQVINHTHELLKSSIAYRMISDVPIGTFLSGGVDSSLVTAIMQNISPKPVNTFSIGFKESKYNEADFAANVAKHLGTNHHEFILSEKDALEKVNTLFESYDEPFADISAIPTLLVSQMARKHVTVCLTGDGGDELFHGYNRYLWQQRLNNPLLKLVNKPAIGLFGMMSERYRHAAAMMSYTKDESLSTHIHSQDAYAFSSKEIESMMPSGSGRFEILSEKSYPRVLSNMEKQSLFDLNYYLRDDLLYKVDIASMRYSLELREPLLDYRLIEYGLNVDPALKCKKGNHKYILKKILYYYLPEEIFNRPKWGFTAPLKVWLRNDLNYLVDEFLSDKAIKGQHVISHEYMIEMRKLYQKGDDYLYQRIWTLICFQRWYKNHF